MSRHFYTIFLIFLFLQGYSLSAASKTDFLIIGEPRNADLFNEYEMELSGSEREKLPDGIPFQIVNAKQLMGDQIRQGMHLLHFSTPYYLILDDNGKTVGLPPSAEAKTFRNCTPVSDTVTIGISAVKVYDRYPSQGKTTLLKKGTPVVRIFKYRNATYLYRLSPPVMYGWTHVHNTSFKSSVTPPKKSAEDFTYLHNRIMQHLGQINNRYDSLFTFFNSVTGQQKSIPEWTYEQSGALHRYTLSGANETVMQLAGSTHYIVGEIEKFLLGKPFSVSYENGVITVSRR